MKLWWRRILVVSLALAACGGEGEVRVVPAATEEKTDNGALVTLGDGERVVGLIADATRLAWVRVLADGTGRVEQRTLDGVVETRGTLAKLPLDFVASIPSLVAFDGEGVAFIDPGAKRVHTDRDVSLDEEPVGLARDASGNVFVVARTSVVRVDGSVATSLATLENKAFPCRIAIDDGFVWFGEKSAWRVVRVPLDGGAAETYADRRRLACGVSVDAARATWIDVDPTLRVFVTRFDKRTSPPPDYIPAASTEVGYYTPSGFLVDLAVFGGHAMTANAEDGNVVDVDLDATEKRTLVDGVVGLSSVASSENGVYYADARGIWRVAR